MTNTQLNNALFEILLNIGTSFDLKQTVNIALSSYLQQLDCAGVVLYKKKHDEYQIHTIKPKIFKNDQKILEVFDGFKNNIQQIENDVFNQEMPYITTLDDTTYYIFKLKDFGLLMFIKNDTTFNTQICKALRQINVKFTNSLISCENIIDLRQKDSIYAQQSKMAAMGEMLQNIAHQWRQPLSVVSAAASGLCVQKKVGVSSTQNDIETLEKIIVTTDYMSNTINDFNNIANPSKEKTQINLKDIYENTFHLINSKYEDLKIEVIENLHDIKVLGYYGELSQVIINLLNNARDVLETKTDQKRLLFVDIYTFENSAIIQVKDNGGGISEENLNRIFEPYFTTKHKSQGTGIGLYMSDEIITKHFNGLLKVENDEFVYENHPYKGALFTITLPLLVSQ